MNKFIWERKDRHDCVVRNGGGNAEALVLGRYGRG